ncbi:MAG: response regulator, partial [Alphaproteobacteria bacterium]
MNERTAPTSPEGWSFVIDEATRILVADDDPILCEFATVYLATPKTEIVTVPNGDDAWEKLRSGQFDIALVDIEMPGIDGFTLVERIRADATLKHLPVIMVTGREDAVSIDRAYRVGATSFVTKPVNWRQLSHQIRYVIRASRAERDAVVSRDQAIDTARLKSNMLSVMRHEFRTPLNAIMGFSKLIATEAHGPVGAADYRDHAHHISEAGASLMRLFGDLMALSELSSATPDDLREDAYRIETILRDGVTAGKGTAETIKARMIAPANCEILCDREQMMLAVGHLLRNALTHGGGSA